MSIISNVHDVTKYDPKNSKPFNGQRLVKISYRKEKNIDGSKKDSKCVSIPKVSLVDIEPYINSLKPQILELILDTQNKIIREKIDEGNNIIQDSDIDLKSCIEYLSAETSTGRLTKEFLADWFDENLEEPLLVYIANKLNLPDDPTEEQTKQLTNAIAEFKDKISALAGGKTSYMPKLCETLKRALQLVPDDSLAVKLIKKLDAMIELSKPGNSLLDSL